MRFARTALFLLLPASVLAGCGEQKPQASAPPPPEVIVARPVKKTIVDKDEYVGRFVAVDSVEVRARVSGYLDKIHFSDGQIVKEGDPLFTIDKRPFQNLRDQARAVLAQSRANQAFTEGDLQRAQTLVRDRTISEQVFEQRMQAKRTADASVAANEAAVRQAELDLEYAELRATVTGRIGDRRVSPGNLVAGGTGGNTATLLATIVSTDPIRLEFTFDEAAYLRYMRFGGDATKDITSRSGKTPVALKLLDEKEFVHQGMMDFVDNVIDRSSGTIRGRAAFKNPKDLFTPGMFARVQVPASAPYDALTVPDVAIGSEQVRKFVFVVDEQNMAQPRYVTLGPVVEGRRVVKEGLNENDRVIVNGLMRVRPGVKVTPKEEAPGGPQGPQAKNT